MKGISMFKRSALMKWVLFIVLTNACCLTLAQKIIIAPYLQPGNTGDFSKEQKVVIWETDDVPGHFRVVYSLRENNTDKAVADAKITSVSLRAGKSKTLLYRATLPKLKFDAEYQYEVFQDQKTISKSSFRTRTKKPKTQFAVFGDFGAGRPAQKSIALQIAKRRPDFILTTGDNVYSAGLYREYHRNFFPYYLDSVPLLNHIPLYMVIGNHDVRGNDLEKFPGGLAYFYYNDLPLNAPETKLTLTVKGTEDEVNAFVKNTKPRFPRMLNYSFDYGNVHFTCLDANYYVNPLDEQLITWISEDIRKSSADWKIVVYHHPAFNSSNSHYTDQTMRLLSPVLEQLKVDLVLSGHVHNYQRTVPLKFSPKTNEQGTQYLVSPEGLVDGTFKLDNDFDGKTDTTPDGIIYIVTGAGGASLYDIKQSGNPALWVHEPPSNWVPFTKELISNIHSFTWIETSQKEFYLTQIDSDGKVIDQIKITKD
jgi:acid phosphatase type 7